MDDGHPHMRLTVIGLGYLGLTQAACLADLGHEVIGVDIDPERVNKAAQGKAPFHEPGLDPLLSKNLDLGRLRFTTSFAEAGRFGAVHFLCVSTPGMADGSADLLNLNTAAEALARQLYSPCLVVGKSTVPIGTARKLNDQINKASPAGRQVEVAWNPEFVREGSAVQDTLAPDRLVFGVMSEWAAVQLRTIYARLLAAGIAGLVMDLETAELVKVAANAFLSIKISFINAMADICDAVGADVVPLAKALSYDKRIGGQHLTPGLGFGGGCLPKDLRAFRATSETLRVESAATLLRAVDRINVDRRTKVAEMAREILGGSVSDRRIAVLGIAFKPGSDDIRESPSLYVCERLRREGAIVSVHDPAAMSNAILIQPDLRYSSSIGEAAENADLVLLLTEWDDYRAIHPSTLDNVVAHRSIIDARCVLDAVLWRTAGWSFHALGRP